MSDSLVRLAVLLLRPVEVWHAARTRRAYRKGRFRRPADIGSGAVTTVQRSAPAGVSRLTTRQRP